MASYYVSSEASEDFNKARLKATIAQMLNILQPQRQELLSFEDVRSLLQPKGQSYLGMKAVEVKLIIGSEGRYQDFNKEFLPRHDYLRQRWTRVDSARIQDITLPPIQLFELGGVYFVRDGNHRVSVARSLGTERIDAEVVSLNSEITLNPDATIQDLTKAIIDWEKIRFNQQTKFNKFMPGVDLNFTTPGQYEEVLSHIYVHKYFVNQEYEEELPFYYTLISWYETVFLPIITLVHNEDLLFRFPGRTDADLYVWIVKHWHYLKENYGDSVSPEDAVQSFSREYGESIGSQFKRFFIRVIKTIFRKR